MQFYLFSFFSFFTIVSIAQQPAKSVFIELSGPGGFISANYDTRFLKSNKVLCFRAGVGTLFDFYNVGFTIPVGLNYLAGEKNHFFEIDAGASFFHFVEKNQDSWFSFKKENFITPYVWIGYRAQSAGKKLTFRAGLCQFFTDLNIDGIFNQSLYPSLSLGYSIRK